MADDHGGEPPKRRSKYADNPYAVGKGKTPVEYRFKKGQPSPNPKGRPKGSKNRTSLQCLLAKRVVVGHDERGKPVRRTLNEVVDHKLVEQATEAGGIRAIELLKKLEIEYAKINRSAGPTREEIEIQVGVNAEKAMLAARLTTGINAQLDILAQLKKMQLIEFTPAGGVKLATWAAEAHRSYQAADRAD